MLIGWHVHVGQKGSDGREAQKTSKIKNQIQYEKYSFLKLCNFTLLRDWLMDHQQHKYK